MHDSSCVFAIIDQTVQSSSRSLSVKELCQIAGESRSVTSEFNVDGIDLNYSRISLKTGDTAVLKAKISPDDAYDKTVIWSVDETKALELIPGGTEGSASLSCKIKAHDGARQAVVTATTRDGEYTVSCVVKIKIPGQADALELDIESNEIWLGVGETYTFNVLEGDLGEVTSSNPQVAKVDGRTITALDYGEADITIKDANYKDNEFVIHVNVPIPDDHLYFGIYESSTAGRMAISPSSTISSNSGMSSVSRIYL